MAENRLRSGVTRTRTPKLDTLNKDPLTKSLISLLVPERTRPLTPDDVEKDKSKSKISKQTIEKITKITSTNIDSNKELLESVPGAMRAKQILTASILSPRNLRSTELTYNSEAYEGKNNDLNTLLLAEVDDHVEGNYKITDKLPDIIGDALFNTGSYVTAILSESSLDNVINGYTRASMESISDEYDTNTKAFRNRSILGDRGTVTAIQTASLEDLMEGNPVTMKNPWLFGDVGSNSMFTDNESILKLPRLKMAIARDQLSRNIRVPVSIMNNTRGVPGVGNLDYPGTGKIKGKHKEGKDTKGSKTPILDNEQYAQMYNSLFKQREYTQADTVIVSRDDQLTKENISEAMVMRLPSECVVRVHMPGEPDVLIGAYVFIDENGHPLATANYDNMFLDKEQNKADTTDGINGTKGIVEMARQLRDGKECTFDMTSFYAEYERELELELTQRLANGVYGQTLTIGLDNSAKRMMFSRTLRNLRTRILYLPAESLSYIAFDYNNLGIGRSLLDKSRLYASMAMANVVATSLAQIANSTNITVLDIPLDENDDEPEQTVEDVVTTHLNTTLGMSTIIGAKNPREICSILDSASVLVKTQGNPYFPSINAEVTNTKRDVTPPDTDWFDRLMDMLALQWGIRSELINPNNDVKFAVEHIQNDALFCKELQVYQDKLCNGVSDLVRKLVYKSGPLMNRLFTIIVENKSKWAPTTKAGKAQLKEFKENNPDVADNDEALAYRILVNFINSIYVSLPSPDITDSEDFNRAYDTERQFAESVIKDYYTEEVLSSFIEGGEDAFEAFRNTLVASHMREWLRDSGNGKRFEYLGELGDESNASSQHLSNVISFNKTAVLAGYEFLKLKEKVKEELQKKFDGLNKDDSYQTDNPDDFSGGGGGNEETPPDPFGTDENDDGAPKDPLDDGDGNADDEPKDPNEEIPADGDGTGEVVDGGGGDGDLDFKV